MVARTSDSTRPASAFARQPLGVLDRRRHGAVEQVGRGDGKALPRQSIGKRNDVFVEAPPRVEHDDAGDARPQHPP